MYSVVFLLFSFLTPVIKLDSGKKIKLKGKGPPLLFSTGLFGSMPNFLYNNIQNKLAKNFTLLLNIDYKPIEYSDIDNIVDKLEVDYISLFAHSSMDNKILESDKLNKIIVCDPITIPTINLDGLSNKKIRSKAQILSIKAEKLYNSDLTLPQYQDPIFLNNKLYSETIYLEVGHPDILDNTWADLAIFSTLWKGASADKKINKFNEWKYKKQKNRNNEIYKKREEYRKFVVDEICQFINL